MPHSGLLSSMSCPPGPILQPCSRASLARKPSPITPTLREHIHTFLFAPRGDFHTWPWSGGEGALQLVQKLKTVLLIRHQCSSNFSPPETLLPPTELVQASRADIKPSRATMATTPQPQKVSGTFPCIDCSRYELPD